MVGGVGLGLGFVVFVRIVWSVFVLGMVWVGGVVC